MAPPKKLDPKQARQQAFKQYQQRRQTDGFESNAPKTKAQVWNNFLGERGERLRAVLAGFDVVGNPRYPPVTGSSLLLVRDVLERLSLPIPDLPALRLCEWLTSFQGGRPVGWREVTPGIAQTTANDGRAALVIGVGPEVESLAALVYPDQAASAHNPTILMVSNGFALAPGTTLQGFRGTPCRFFANS